MKEAQNYQSRRWWLWYAWTISGLLTGGIAACLNVVWKEATVIDPIPLIPVTCAIMGYIMHFLVKMRWPNWNNGVWPIFIITSTIIIAFVTVIIATGFISTAHSLTQIYFSLDVLPLLLSSITVPFICGGVGAIIAMIGIFPRKNTPLHSFALLSLILLGIPTGLVAYAPLPPHISPIMGLFLKLSSGYISSLLTGLVVVYCGVSSRLHSSQTDPS